MPLLHDHLYLASASPRRHDILRQMQIAHEVVHVPSPDGEDEPRLAGESPLQYVTRTAADKLQRASLWAREQGLASTAAILTADTTVALGNEVLGKPARADQAAEYLRRLSGTTHQVYTAVSLAYREQVFHALSTNKVSFALLSEEEIQAYCLSGEPMGKAGAYAIQGQGGVFVQRLEGSHSAVVGLPMHETYTLLRDAGLLLI